MCIPSQGTQGTILIRYLQRFAIGRCNPLLTQLQPKKEIDACYKSNICDSATFKAAIKIQNVAGLNDRSNDVLYCPPFTKEQCNVKRDSTDHGTVVFFGGDMQDFHENMISKEETRKYSEWSLENISKLLSNHYKNCHIIVIRPSSIEDGIFSKYSNFVPSSKYGVPNFTPNYGSLFHLSRLIKNLHKRVINMDFEDIKQCTEHTCESLQSKSCCIPVEDEYRKDFTSCYIELVAFSKGCVVLNQFLHEFHQFKKSNVEDAEEVNDLIDRIKTMRWLDGGHSGRQQTWITSEDILANYAEMGKRTYVHVTPYQVLCSKRPWIGKEEEIFTRTLAEKNVEIKRKLHMDHSKGTLDDHFNLLKEVFSNDT